MSLEDSQYKGFPAWLSPARASPNALSLDETPSRSKCQRLWRSVLLTITGAGAISLSIFSPFSAYYLFSVITDCPSVGCGLLYWVRRLPTHDWYSLLYTNTTPNPWLFCLFVLLTSFILPLNQSLNLLTLNFHLSLSSYVVFRICIARLVKSDNCHHSVQYPTSFV
jgi:hypothetical protein